MKVIKRYYRIMVFSPTSRCFFQIPFIDVDSIEKVRKIVSALEKYAGIRLWKIIDDEWRTVEISRVLKKYYGLKE